MDSNPDWGYKGASIFSGSKRGCNDLVGTQMDKDFLRQIDQVNELLSELPDLLDDEVLICECFCVSVGDIRKTCAEARKVDIRLLQNQLSLGHGCQSCLKNKETWVNKIF